MPATRSAAAANAVAAAAAAAAPVDLTADTEGRRTSLEAAIKFANHTETHVLRVHDFDKLALCVGPKVEGPVFEVGGEKFRVRVNPGGSQELYKGHVSVFLYYEGTKDGLDASCSFSVTHSASGAAVLNSQSYDVMFAKDENKEKGWVQSWGPPRFVKHDQLEALSGCLTLTVEVTVRGAPTTTALQRIAEPQTVVLPPRSSSGDWLAALASGALSDVGLRPSPGGAAAAAAAVRAHKIVLAARSPVFAAMFTQGMAEASSSEVTLEGVSGAVLGHLVHFLYAEEVGADAFDDAEGLLAAADQYQVPRLLALCERELCERIEVETAARLLLLADQHHAEQLKERCLEFIGEQPGEVMATEGWQLLGTQPNLLQELFAHSAGVRKRPADGAEGGGGGSKKRKTT
jgi:speckle-type POZ protein